MEPSKSKVADTKEPRYNLIIRIADAENDKSYIEVRHEGCPQSALLDKQIIGPILKERLHLIEEGIQHLEVTL